MKFSLEHPFYRASPPKQSIAKSPYPHIIPQPYFPQSRKYRQSRKTYRVTKDFSHKRHTSQQFVFMQVARS